MNTETLIRLLTWVSPAFPTGAYAYSHGLEWAAEAGDIRDETTLGEWLHDLLLYGAGRNDAILLRHAHRLANDVKLSDAALLELAQLASAMAGSRERKLETMAQGAAFVMASAPWPCPPLAGLAATLDGQVAYPVSLGVLAGFYAIPEDVVAAALVHGFAANLVSAALRLAPIGQGAGLRVLAALEPVVAQIVEDTRFAGLDELGGSCFRSDIAAMKHETQYSRIFRS